MSTLVISPTLRDILIEHIDGPVGVDLSIPHIMNRLRGAQALGFIRFDRPTRPRHSTLTESGRMALAEALGDWAEALSRAHRGRDLIGQFIEQAARTAKTAA